LKGQVKEVNRRTNKLRAFPNKGEGKKQKWSEENENHYILHRERTSAVRPLRGVASAMRDERPTLRGLSMLTDPLRLHTFPRLSVFPPLHVALLLLFFNYHPSLSCLFIGAPWLEVLTQNLSDALQHASPAKKKGDNGKSSGKEESTTYLFAIPSLLLYLSSAEAESSTPYSYKVHTGATCRDHFPHLFFFVRWIPLNLVKRENTHTHIYIYIYIPVSIH
jgi:hypothetical protein